MQQDCEKHEKMILSNRDELSKLSTDMLWIKKTLEEHTTILKFQTEVINKVDRTVHNGLTEKMREVHKRVVEVETDLNEKVNMKDVEKRKVNQYRSWQGWVQTVMMFATMAGVIISLIL